MPYQPITATVASADVTAIKAATATIQQKLPFLITLTDAERKSLPKAGANSLSFIEHAQTGEPCGSPVAVVNGSQRRFKAA